LVVGVLGADLNVENHEEMKNLLTHICHMETDTNAMGS